MRMDDVGLWWQDYKPPPSTNHSRIVVNAPVPQTGWTPPKEFPNLSGARVLGIDTETKDLKLREMGPGAIRGDSHIVGVSVATEDKAWYFPIAHEFAAEKHLNMDKDRVLAWVKDVCALPCPKVGANLLYDYEQLKAVGIEVAGDAYDVQWAEALIDEEARTYALENIAQKYLGEGKHSDTLYAWCAHSFGGKANGDQRDNIYRAPPSLVGPYAEGDALQPLRILREQRKILEEQKLMSLFRIESGLLPLLLKMRFKGVRIDLERAQEVAKWLRAEAKKAQDALGNVDVWSGDSIARAFDKEKVKYPRTEAGNPSFRKEWLEAEPHPLAQRILAVRQYEKAANPFVESYLLENHINGRIHCQFHPLRSDNYGTVSGRFSSSNPNLQNIPSRNKIIGPMLRSLFIPEEGCKWRRGDYSQIEYRLLIHYAKGPGADELRERYNKDPTTDFHQLAIDMCHEITGVKLDRTPAKNLNFGLVYGMGKDKTTRSLGVAPEVGLKLYNAYHTALPAVRETSNECSRLASRRGFIRTILNRRRRFESRNEDQQREGTHKALNSLLQGGAADVMKKAMHDIYKAGIYDVIGVPHLTVHDELDGSDDGSKEAAEAYTEAKRIMETCIKLKVPLRVDEAVGSNWGECK